MSDIIDSFRLDGKVALVTGATYGIGMAIAEALGEAGAKIAFNARHADKVAEAEKHYRELGFDAHGYVADVTDEAVVAELIAKIEADFGTTPDILINNAGVIQRTPMLDMSAEDFRRVVDIDLNAPFIVSKACLPGMIAKGHGKIINICSMMSELGRETIAGYAAAKGGLKMLTKNICSEFGEANIQCNGIGPGYIATPQTAPLRETQPDGSRHPFDQFIIAKTPAARWGTPEGLKGPPCSWLPTHRTSSTGTSCTSTAASSHTSANSRNKETGRGGGSSRVGLAAARAQKQKTGKFS